jgi:hypothetical protein
MKISLFCIFLAFLAYSCSAPHYISNSENTSNSVKSLEMTQRFSAYPVGKNKKKSKEGMKLKAVHHLEVEKDGKANLSIEFISNKSKSVSETDSTIDLVLNTEKISITRLSVSKFCIPENLWVPIANCDKIEYLVHLGAEEFEVCPEKNQVKELNYFFERAIRTRDANLPPIPEGLKKW